MLHNPLAHQSRWRGDEPTTNLPDHPPIPLTILTGFLGAGKTTLLNRILAAEHGLRIAVLVNDFGPINIDAQLIIGVEDAAISLANGCICCSIREDLVTTVLEVLQRPERPAYLIIEASGIADPWAIASTFVLSELRTHTQLDSIITVVDTEQVRQQALAEHTSELIHNQITAADIILLNKIDLVDASQRAEIVAWVRQLVPEARLLETVQADAPLALLLGLNLGQALERLTQPHATHTHADGEPCDHPHPPHDHTSFTTWSYESTQPFALKQVREVIKSLPTTIFRAKGILALAESRQRRTIFQLAGSRFTLTIGAPWGPTPPRTQMIFISPPGGLDPTELQHRLDACLHQDDAAPEDP